MNSNPSDLQLAGELHKIDQLRELLGKDAEPQLILDVIEGETNALEMVDAIIEAVLADELLEQHARTRAKALEERANRRRAIIMQVMERAGLRHAKRALYTVNVIDGPKSVHITDENQLPLNMWRMAPDKTLIGKTLKDGTEVPGAQLNNGPPYLRIDR